MGNNVKPMSVAQLRTTVPGAVRYLPKIHQDSGRPIGELSAKISLMGPKEAYDKVAPNLFVGTREALTESINRERFTHIVTVTDHNDMYEEIMVSYGREVEFRKNPGTFAALVNKKTRDCIEWLHLPLLDNPTTAQRDDAMTEFAKVFREHGYPFIKNALENRSNRVLIHCDSGVNRSASFAMAYLVKRYSEDRGVPLDTKYAHNDDVFFFLNGGAKWFKEAAKTMRNNDVFNAAYHTILTKRRGAVVYPPYLPAVTKIANKVYPNVNAEHPIREDFTTHVDPVSEDDEPPERDDELSDPATDHTKLSKTSLTVEVAPGPGAELISPQSNSGNGSATDRDDSGSSLYSDDGYNEDAFFNRKK